MSKLVIGDRVLLTRTIATDVNTLTIGGAATNFDIVLQAGGADTDVGIGIVPKGLGDITLASGGGLVIINNLPATDPFVEGALYSDSGTLKVSAGE